MNLLLLRDRAFRTRTMQRQFNDTGAPYLFCAVWISIRVRCRLIEFHELQLQYER